MTSTTEQEHVTTARIEADPTIPGIRFVRDFQGSVEQLFRAHTDPELFVRWNGPNGMATVLQVVGRPHRWRVAVRHQRRATAATPSTAASTRYAQDRIVQTFTFDGYPDGVALETITFTDLGDGRTRLEALSLCDSFEGRDMMLASGMEVGVHEGYAKLDGVLAEL